MGFIPTFGARIEDIEKLISRELQPTKDPLQSETFHHISAMFISSSSLENCCSPTLGDGTVIGSSLKPRLSGSGFCLAASER